MPSFPPDSTINLTDSHRHAVSLCLHLRHRIENSPRHIYREALPGPQGDSWLEDLHGVLGLVEWLSQARVHKTASPLLQARSLHVFKVKNLIGVEPEIFTFRVFPQIPLQDLLTHADGTRSDPCIPACKPPSASLRERPSMSTYYQAVILL